MDDEQQEATPPPPTVRPASTAQRHAQSSPEAASERHDVVHIPLNRNHDAAANELEQPNDPKAARVEDDALLHQFEDMTLAAAQAAKDYRFLMLEHMKINMTAALSCANCLTAVSAGVASAANRDASEHRTDPHPQRVDEATPTGGKVAQEYGVKALGFMTDNMNTTLEYAQRLAHVQTPSEFVELTASQARKQIELMVKQTGELGSIARKLTPQDIASMAGNFAKLLGERKQ